MLDDLKKHNRLDRDVCTDEITSFAQFLSKLLNERFFDYREKEIWALQQIDSFMVANDLVNQSDMLSFSLIKDNWDYADLPVRKAGFRISGGVLNDYSFYSNDYKYSNDTMNSKNISTSYNFHLIGKLDSEKPVYLYWQFFY